LEQCFYVPYALLRPNQQCESTEGTNTKTTELTQAYSHGLILCRKSQTH